MKNLTEFVAGDEMKYYLMKMLKKLPDFGLMFIELEDFLSLSLGKLVLWKQPPPPINRGLPLTGEKSQNSIFAPCEGSWTAKQD
jgi:hypothetical protein